MKSGNYRPADFIIADAKDGDMAFGIPAPGPVAGNATGLRYKTRKEYLANITAMAQSGLVDIMLTSASNSEQLQKQALFSNTDVTPAIRLNDTTDIWSARGSNYRDTPSRPFATVHPEDAGKLCPFGLYGITFYNDIDADLKTLEAYNVFRQQARAAGVQHFLEVFNPPYDINLTNAELGDYVNDMILKTLAGVTSADAPLFLKMQFNGHRAMSDLASYDPDNLIVGILGGAAGTTRDTFELAKQAETAGARIALFGRKINLAESPVELVRLLRAVIENETSASDAVAAYHDHLQAQGITPLRALSEDNQITDPVLQ
ncbi:MAG: hypothetical protein AAF404_20365 [Pseudomonadota bacterium]